MNLEQLTCVLFGSILNSFTFAIGIAVGITFAKRTSKDVNNNSKKTASQDSEWLHTPSSN
jgi:hypothetical protein